MVAVIADLTIIIVAVYCDVFLGKWILFCHALFANSNSKQSYYQFVAQSETNLLTLLREKH